MTSFPIISLWTSTLSSPSIACHPITIILLRLAPLMRSPPQSARTKQHRLGGSLFNNVNKNVDSELNINGTVSTVCSSADLLGAGLHHEDHQVCQIHRARHRPPAATLLHHRVVGAALRAPTRCGDQCDPGPGQRAFCLYTFILKCVCFPSFGDCRWWWWWWEHSKGTKYWN